MAGLNNVDIGDKFSWFKWQYGVIIGAPITLGIGYWYLLRKSKSDPPPKLDSNSDLNKGNVKQACSSVNSSITNLKNVSGTSIDSSVPHDSPKVPTREEV